MDSQEPENSLAGSVAAGGVWGLIGRVAVLVVTLLATPFTIRLLGPSAYGLWALFQTVLTWAALADLGMATASTKFAAQSYAARDDLGESAVIWTALSLTVFATLAVAVAVGIEAPEILNLLHVPAELARSGVLALRIVCGVFVAQSVAGTVNTPQVVRLRWGQYTLITQSANIVLIGVVPVALALISGGVLTASAVWLGAATLGALGNAMLALHYQPALRQTCLRRDLVRPLLSYGGALTVSGLAQIPLMTAERFLLANNHSTVVIAEYLVAWSLGTILLVLPEQLIGPLMPGLVRLEAAGRVAEHRALYRMSLQGLYLVLVPAVILLAFVAHPFLAEWAGPIYGRYSTGPFFVILAGLLFNAFSYVPFSYLYSCGRTKTIAYIHLAEIVPYLVGAEVLTAHFGALGAAFAWSARVLIDSVICFMVVRRVAHLPSSPLSSRRVLAVAGPVTLGAAVIALATVAHGLFPRLAFAIGLGVVYAATTWQVLLSRKEREGLLALLVQIRSNGGPS